MLLSTIGSFIYIIYLLVDAIYQSLSYNIIRTLSKGGYIMLIKASKFINNKIFILIFLFCIILVIFSLFTVHSNRIIFTEHDKYEGINTEIVNYNKEKFDIYIKYPTTKNKKVNDKIKEFVNTNVKNVVQNTKFFIPKSSEDKFKLEVIYDVERANEDIISFVFIANNYYNNTLNKDIITKNYNLKTGQELNLQNFFDERLGFISVLCSKSKIALLNNETINEKNLNFFIDDISFTSLKSFDGYSFSNTHLAIYFNSNKISSEYTDIYEIKIPWEEVDYLLKENIELMK